MSKNIASEMAAAVGLLLLINAASAVGQDRPRYDVGIVTAAAPTFDDLIEQEPPIPPPVRPQNVPRTTPATPPRPGATPNAAAPPAPKPAAPANPAPPAPAATTPPTPPAADNESTTDLAAAMNANAAANAASTRAGLNDVDFRDTPIMLGDQAPLFVRQFNPNAQLHAFAQRPGGPPIPPSPNPGRSRGGFIVPSARALKIADNMSPLPQDRFFFTFNNFQNLNGTINKRLGSSLGGAQLYRETFGFEKTFLDGNASVGLFMPLDTMSIASNVRGLGGTTTAVDNMTFFSKFILLKSADNRRLLTGGLAVSTPNGPTTLAGARNINGFHDTQIQPFLGYIWTKGRFYAQGFESIAAPTNAADVTMMFSDVGIGYYTWISPDPKAFLTSLAPTLEGHLNTPLNHRGAFAFNDPASTPDVFDFTYGINAVFRRSSILSVALVTPTTGPRPFNLEWAVFYTRFFGRTRANYNRQTPPILGQ